MILGRHTLTVGDCVAGMAALPDCSVDSVVTDPPYLIGFMAKEWDKAEDPIAWHRRWLREALRVLKPGGHLVAFSATRADHWLKCAAEAEGFELRDTIHWCYWSGFPKSLDVSKAIDRAAGAEREVVGAGKCGAAVVDAGRAGNHGGGEFDITAPHTPDAIRWQGWGTALKPAVEPALLARKPLSGTVAATVLEYGTGAINVDACRFAYGDPMWPGPGSSTAGEWDRTWSQSNAPMASRFDAAARSGAQGDPSLGRFPANLVYCPKPSTAEREAGCEGLRQQSAGELTGGRAEGSDGLNSPRAGAGRGASPGLTVVGALWHADTRWVNEVLNLALPVGTVRSRGPDTGACETLSRAGSDSSMCSCGSPTTDLSRPGFRSTIETAISSTTRSGIWKRSTRPHTSGCMAAASFVVACGGSLAASAGTSSLSAPSTGTSAAKAGPCTGDADPATSAESWKTNVVVVEALKRNKEVGVEDRRSRGNFHPT